MQQMVVLFTEGDVGWEGSLGEERSIRDFVRHPKMHRKAPYNKELFGSLDSNMQI